MLILARPPKMKCLSDVINWGIMGEPSIVVTKQAELFSVLKYTPRDLHSSSPEQLVSARAALNKTILRLGPRWCVWFEAMRFESSEFDHSEWPDNVSRLIDRRRRELFTKPGQQFSTESFATILYSPPDDAIGKIAAQFEHAGEDERTDQKRIAKEFGIFQRGVDEFHKHLAAFMPKVRKIEGPELLAFLHNTISTRRRPVLPQPMPLYIAEYLADEEFLGGRSPMLGDHHLRTIRIKGLPDETMPGVFGDLEKLNFPYRRVARWIPLSREDAQRELEARKKGWANKRVPLLRKIMSRYIQDDGSRDNLAATLAMEKADVALTALAGGDFAFGYWTHTITLTHPDLDILNERIKTVRLILESRGFGAPVATDDAMSVWIGSLPGHPHGDLGRLLGCSLSFADILPATAVWEGAARDEHLAGPPMLRGIGEGGTPFKMTLHQSGSDVGHTLIIGQTGSGKSVLVGAMIAAHRRYPRSRVIIIDRGASAKCITLALGGEFHALAAEDAAVSLQPLAFIHHPAERAWACEWAIGCLSQEGLDVSPMQKNEITLAINTLASRPSKQRTLSILRALIQDNDVKVALSPFCLGGAYGDLLDNDEHRLGDDKADVVCFETAALMERPMATGPVLATVFHAIERGFDGRPTLFIVDEAWAALDHPLLASRLRGYLKTARKANVALVLATQSLADVRSSTITEVLSESCPQRLFTANDRAMEAGSARVLEDFGLSQEQIRIISELRPKSEYVFTVNDQWRQFELRLSPVELAFIGRSRPEDRTAMDRILANGRRSEFPWRWLTEHCGFHAEQVAAWRHEVGDEPLQWANAAE